MEMDGWTGVLYVMDGQGQHYMPSPQFFEWRGHKKILISPQKCCGYSLEVPPQCASNEYVQHMFLWRNKNYLFRFPWEILFLIEQFFKCSGTLKQFLNCSFAVFHNKCS